MSCLRVKVWGKECGVMWEKLLENNLGSILENFKSELTALYFT